MLRKMAVGGVYTVKLNMIKKKTAYHPHHLLPVQKKDNYMLDSSHATDTLFLC